MHKYTILTLIFNNYEPIRDPLVIDPNAEYVCVTDDPNLKSDIWKVIYEPKYDTDKLTGMQKSFMTKYTLFDYVSSDSEYVIQIDGALEITNSLNELIDYYADNNFDLGVALHPVRNDWIDEYVTWMMTRNLNFKYLIAFLRYLFNHPLPDLNINNCGLIETTCKIYKNCDIVKNFVKDIYDGLNEEAGFKDLNEQCIFTHTLYKYSNKLNIQYFRGNLYMDGKYIKRYWHNTMNEIRTYKRYNSLEEFSKGEMFHKPVYVKSFNDDLLS